MPAKDAREITITLNPDDIDMSKITGCENLFEEDYPTREETVEEMDERLDDMRRDFTRLIGIREERKRKAEQDEAAREIYSLYKSFVKNGFTEEQAWEMFMSMVKAGLGK